MKLCGYFHKSEKTSSNSLAFYTGICYDKNTERSEENMPYTALNVASAVITMFHQQEREISNLKLQKILYYIQMKSLQDLGNPAFSDDIEAWRHGPVVRNVYSVYKKYISKHIDPDDESVQKNQTEVCPELKSVIADIVKRTRDISAWDLVAKTHETTPWMKNYRVNYSNTIQIDDIKKGSINI